MAPESPHPLGFHLLPPQTVRAVFPHTAFRWSISSRCIQGYFQHTPLPMSPPQYRTRICRYTSSWLPGIACAEVVVIFWIGVVGLFRHAPSLTSPLLPDQSRGPFLLPGYVVPAINSTMASSDSSLSVPPDFTSSAYTGSYGRCELPTEWVLPWFHHLLSQHPAPHTPEGS